MAYKGYYLPSYGSSNAEGYSNFCAILQDLGWELYDEVSSTVKVFRSNGEDGDRPYVYVWTQLFSNQIRIEAYLFWDNVAHAGTCKVYSSTSVYALSLSDSDPFLLAGDKNFVVAASNPSTVQAFGFMPKRFNSTWASLSAGATAGSSVTLTVNQTTGFKVGQRYQLVGSQYTEGAEIITIEEVVDSTHLKVVTLSIDYASGAVIGSPALDFVKTGGSSTKTYYYGFLKADETTFPETCYSGSNTIQSLILSSCLDEDTFILKHHLSAWFVPMQPSELGGYCDENILYANAPSHADILAVNNDNTIFEGGTATTGASLSLTDSTKSWATDEKADRVVIIISGTGAGQVRRITTNTGTVLTINEDWTTIPDATSIYKIADEAYRFYSSLFLAAKETNWVLPT